MAATSASALVTRRNRMDLTRAASPIRTSSRDAGAASMGKTTGALQVLGPAPRVGLLPGGPSSQLVVGPPGVGFGHYATWSDDDISTVVTKTTYYQVWLSASGTRVYRKQSSWCDLPANIVIPVVLAAGAFVVAGLAVGAAKLLLWLW